MKTTDMILEYRWDELEDQTFIENDDGELILNHDWYCFKYGSTQEEIWHWFDRYHSKGVHYLLYER